MMEREGARPRLFSSITNMNRFEDCKHLDFVEERSFSLVENPIKGIKEALEKRN
jgi:hypothetical protein